jgi:hypothetical protein
MKNPLLPIRGAISVLVAASAFVGAVTLAQTPKAPPSDAIEAGQTTRPAADKRPEQKLSPHDRSDAFKAPTAPPSSTVLKTQPDEGKCAASISPATP